MSQLEKIANKSLFKKMIDMGHNCIDYKIGLLSAAGMGTIVFGINYVGNHDTANSLIAASKQASYTFLIGGVVANGCKYLATNIKKQNKALLAAVIIPSVITLALTYGVHNLKGTEKPIKSTLPTLVVFPVTAYWGNKKRKDFLKYNNLKS